MFNKLSMEDKQTIRYYIDNYACDAAHNMAEKASVEHILRFWDSSKSVSLNKLFGEELIISKPFCIEKSEDSISDIFKTSDNIQYNDFLRVFNRKCGSKWDWNRTFSIEWPEDGYLLSELVSPINLAKNIWEGKTFKVPLENGKFITIQKGCKITRVLGKLAAAWNIEALFEHFRIFHSQVLNDKELRGELCLSIHPLDYLTMSDNDCNWSSCMSWRDYCCYRQGTVEMMNSQFVVVAYLKSKEDMWVSRVHDYYWNSKKWRCLFVVSKDVIVGIKGYPYSGYQLQKETLNWIKELASERLGWEYEDETFRYNGHNIIELKNISVAFDGQQIIENMNLYIRDKEFITFLGPSGCGKTTTFFVVYKRHKPVYFRRIYYVVYDMPDKQDDSTHLNYRGAYIIRASFINLLKRQLIIIRFPACAA